MKASHLLLEKKKKNPNRNTLNLTVLNDSATTNSMFFVVFFLEMVLNHQGFLY